MFKEDFAEFAGLSDDDRLDTGVLAQEVSQVLPDAVRETGDVLLPGGQRIDNFLVVNKVLDSFSIRKSIGFKSTQCQMSSLCVFHLNWFFANWKPMALTSDYDGD